MNFVDFVIDCYSHITSHVSQVFASRTHYTSYSLLNIVHVIVCVYGLTNQVLQIFWILCKIDLMLENFWRMQTILNFGNFGLKFLFLKIISSHTHAFCSSMSMLWVVPKCVFLNVFFLKFSEPLPVSIDPIYFSIHRIFFKFFFNEPLSVSIDRNYFSINRNSWIRFFKTQIWLVQITFSKLFKNFFSLFD